MGAWSSKAELEKLKIQTAATYKPTEIEWAARKEIALAGLKVDEKRVHLDHKYKMEMLTNEKIKNTLHVHTQSEILNKIVEQGFSSDDYCMVAGLSYLTLKDDLAKDEMETLKNTMFEAMEHKKKVSSKRRNRHASESDTGCESDQGSDDNQIVVSTMT